MCCFPVNLKYLLTQEGIETVDNAYEVFLRNGIEDFQHYAFELQTCANKNLNPRRIKEYLEVIHQEQGFPGSQVKFGWACKLDLISSQATADYVFMVMAKYLQMLVAYSIHKEEPDRVTEHFERFNKDFEQVCLVFKEVTHQEYKPGQEVKAVKPLAPVKPIPREPKPHQPQQQTLSGQEQSDMVQFLGRHQLQDLHQIFMREGVTLMDVLEMTEDDMKDVGIAKYALRKRLVKAVREERGDSGSTVSAGEVPVQQPEQQAPAQAQARAVRAEERRPRPSATISERWGEVQSRSSRW